MVYKKLFEITKKVRNIQRDHEIKMRSGESYRVVLSEKVLDTIKPLLEEYNLLYIPTKILNLIQNGDTTIVAIEYLLYDLDDDTKLTVVSIGGGKDKGDKGPGKAFTYCHKYGLLKMVNAKTSDDPDRIASDADDEADELYKELVNKVNLLLNQGKIKKPLHDKLLTRLEEVHYDMSKLRAATEVINGYDNPQPTQNKIDPNPQQTESERIVRKVFGETNKNQPEYEIDTLST